MRRTRGGGLAFLYSFFLAAGVWDSEGRVTGYVTDSRDLGRCTAHMAANVLEPSGGRT
jgi:hypothetical protein